MLIQSNTSSIWSSSDPFLSSFSPSVKSSIMNLLVAKTVEKNTVIYRIGDEPSSMYYIIDGAMRVEYETISGDTCMGNIYGSNTWFGELSTLTGAPRQETVTAIKFSRLVYLRRNTLYLLVNEYPEILEAIAKITESHTRTNRKAFSDLLIRDAKLRMIAVLLRLTDYQKITKYDSQIELCCSQEEIAQRSNIARSTACSILNKLENLGLIELGYRNIIIKNISLLKKIFDTETISQENI